MQTQRMAELDGLRAVAILLVIGFHSWFFLQFTMESKADFLAYSDTIPWILSFIKRGDVGVDVFFVLSGYLLSWQLFKERSAQNHLNLTRFYARRIFRIYPLYLVALALALSGAGLTWRVFGNLLAYNIWLDPFDVIIPWSWSLSVELEFYAIVPLLILLACTGPRVLLTVLALSALAVGWSLWTLFAFPQLTEATLIEFEIAERRSDLVLYYQYLYVAIPVRFSQFAMGLGAAWLVINAREKLKTLPPWPLAAVILAGLALPLIYNPHGTLDDTWRAGLWIDLTFGRVAFAFAIAALIAALQIGRFGKVKSAFSASALEPIARFSFSMYLFHPLFVYVGAWLFVGDVGVVHISMLQYIGVFVTTIACSMGFGALTWYLIERPAIRMGRRWFG